MGRIFLGIIGVTGVVLMALAYLMTEDIVLKVYMVGLLLVLNVLVCRIYNLEKEKK